MICRQAVGCRQFPRHARTQPGDINEGGTQITIQRGNLTSRDLCERRIAALWMCVVVRGAMGRTGLDSVLKTMHHRPEESANGECQKQGGSGMSLQS